MQALALLLPAGSHPARDPVPRRQGRAAPRSPPAAATACRAELRASGYERVARTGTRYGSWSAADGGRASGGGPIASRRAPRARAQSAARPRRARHGAGVRGPGAPSGALPLRGRDAGVPLARRPGPAPGRLPGGGGRPAGAAGGRDAHVHQPSRARRARRRGRGRGAPHGAPLHRGRDAGRRPQADPAALGARRRGVARPAGGGDRDRGGGRPLRGPLPRGARHARRGRAGVARAPRARARRPRAAPAREPVREGVGADSAAQAGGARGGPRGRRPADAPAPAQGAGAGRPPPHRHGVGGHARGHHRARVRHARRARAARRPLRRHRDAGLPARLAGAARSGCSTGAARAHGGPRSWCGS